MTYMKYFLRCIYKCLFFMFQTQGKKPHELLELLICILTVNTLHSEVP